MWSPIDLHNSDEQGRGVHEALLSSLASYPHHTLVSNGEQCAKPLAFGIASAKDVLVALEKCSIAYIGARHGQPIAPYCGFVVGPNSGAARIDLLVEYGDLHADDTFRKWTINGIGGFLILLFLKRPEIQQVLLPFPFPEASFGDFSTKHVHTGTLALRTRPAART